MSPDTTSLSSAQDCASRCWRSCSHSKAPGTHHPHAFIQPLIFSPTLHIGLHVLHVGRDANLRPRKVVRQKTALATDKANPGLQSTGAGDPPLEAKSSAMTTRDAATAPESKSEDQQDRPGDAGFHFSDLAATTLQVPLAPPSSHSPSPIASAMHLAPCQPP